MFYRQQGRHDNSLHDNNKTHNTLVHPRSGRRDHFNKCTPPSHPHLLHPSCDAQPLSAHLLVATPLPPSSVTARSTILIASRRAAAAFSPASLNCHTHPTDRSLSQRILRTKTSYWQLSSSPGTRSPKRASSPTHATSFFFLSPSFLHQGTPKCVSGSLQCQRRGN